MTTLKTFATVAGATLILAGISTGASAYQCKKIGTISNFTATSQPSALAGAKAAWTSKVKARLGLSWSVWNIAAGKVETCSPAGNGYACVVKAKPCNYVVQ